MMKEVILKKLREIETQENVTILFAVESGSRAWGFESKDSDYDVRFIYIRQLEDYLSLKPMSDIINYELNEVFDINGWDLKKALRLLYKSNPTLYEWYNSPLVYKKTEEWQLVDLAFQYYFDIQKAIHHYYHMSNQAFLKRKTLKHYFYCLRTLLSCLWIIRYQTPPPIEFTKLIFILPDNLQNIINEMLILKKTQNEHYYINSYSVLDLYIEEQLLKIKTHLSKTQNKFSYDLLNQTFISILKALSK